MVDSVLTLPARRIGALPDGDAIGRAGSQLGNCHLKTTAATPVYDNHPNSPGPLINLRSLLQPGCSSSSKQGQYILTLQPSSSLSLAHEGQRISLPVTGLDGGLRPRRSPVDDTTAWVFPPCRLSETQLWQPESGSHPPDGVTSFSIDLESKRVTVMGHVSPVGVLESISKVKKAEFWPCS
ncbi:hypothetical protein ZIOFF_073534 [Zingiber officinale]|uniref:Uncharacterized protein n=1 Tax=Zingiber officinale TaxID=94328 RepID=A0A8J5EPC5_ZINOF|nr:hypothetical protein ZIOFF_073534 [Zingiber officinale]